MQPPQFKQRLTGSQIDQCMVGMLRIPELFEFARQNIKPSALGGAGVIRYGLVWSAALDAAARNGGTLPQQGTESCIATELIGKLDNAGEEIAPEIKEETERLLRWIFEFDRSLNSVFYRDLIEDFIIEMTVVRDLNKTASQAITIGRQLDLPETLEQAASRIRELKATRTRTGQNLRDEWGDFQGRLQAYRGREFLGLRTGLRGLDDRTLGLRGLILLGAKPNVGKTALVLHLGINVIKENPDACFLFISLEMDRGAIYSRINSNLAELDWSTVVRGDKSLRGGPGPHFTENQQKRLKVADDWVAQYGHRIRVLDRPGLGDSITAASIQREIKALKAQSGAARALTVIDYLQVIPIPTTLRLTSDLDANKYQLRVAQDILAGMQQESNLLGDAVIAISEARKPATGRRQWGEDLADLMGSARLGYGADAVLLYRRMTDDDITNAYADRAAAPTIEQLENEGIAPIMLTLAKGRDGMRLGEWPLEYHFNRSIFREIERRGRQQLPPGPRPPRPLPPRERSILDVD